LFLGPDGGLAFDTAVRSPESALSFAYDPANPVPTLGGITLLPYPAPGAYDQRVVEERGDVLVFTSEVLTEDVEVTGRVTASLRVATDGVTTDWVVRLCDVHPDGRSYNVVDGIRRVEGAAGEEMTVDVDLYSTSMLFKNGHRIRVQVTSSCFPRWDRNLNTADGATTGDMRVATQTVFVGGERPSYLTLPIIPVEVS
jgi:putative CocE/NonD family hydrolase